VKIWVGKRLQNCDLRLSPFSTVDLVSSKLNLSQWRFRGAGHWVRDGELVTTAGAKGRLI